MTELEPHELPPAETVEVPKVIIATPFHSSVAPGWRQTMRFAVKDHSQVEVVMDAQVSKSSLTACFNALWCIAMNARDEGRVTHLAMVHSDVVADRGWLDLLWGEMWTHRATLISTVIPLKNLSGNTSTAIGSEESRWDIRRLLSLKGVAKLPKTFGREHVCRKGERLLINTGLMLLDLRHPCWDNMGGSPFAFQFHDKVHKGPAGWHYSSRTEDWEMSHDLADAGVHYVATRAPRLFHDGGFHYTNQLEDQGPAIAGVVRA